VTVKSIILDTNAVLRFITGDNEEESRAVSELLNANDCIIPVEVIAEAVYNLAKKYNHSRQEIADEIKDFIGIQENFVVEENAVLFGCNLFAATNLDFVDCLLDGYAKTNGNRVFTFDGDLRKRLGIKAFNG
jgi:predicted nucleic-acid-binding protein